MGYNANFSVPLQKLEIISSFYSMTTDELKAQKKITGFIGIHCIFLLASSQYQKSITATYIASLMFTYRTIVPVGRCINFINF